MRTVRSCRIFGLVELRSLIRFSLLITCRLLSDFSPPKYQYSPNNIAPHPTFTSAPLTYSKSISSFTSPEEIIQHVDRKLINLPSQLMTMGLLAAFLVLRSKTAFVAGGVVVAGAVDIVISGAVVVS